MTTGVAKSFSVEDRCEHRELGGDEDDGRGDGMLSEGSWVLQGWNQGGGSQTMGQD